MPSRRRYDSITTRRGASNTVMIVLAVVLLIAAGAVFAIFGTGKEAPPSDESSWTYYVCEGCGEFFHLTGEEVERALTRKGEAGRTGDGRTIAFRCKKCNELKAVRAGKCPQHDTIVKLMPAEGEPNKCPQCGWRP